jgi:hypothetical protein
MPTDDEIRKILKDPSLSDWLRTSMLSALDRDPVDAANDAGLLAIALDRRAGEIAAQTLAEWTVLKAKRNLPVTE